MKNKEIEELLNELKDVAKINTIEVREYGVVETISSSIVKELRLNNYSANLLLSYIEQLENNRDKAIKFGNGLLLGEATFEERHIANRFLNILKGDSDDK